MTTEQQRVVMNGVASVQAAHRDFLKVILETIEAVAIREGIDSASFLYVNSFMKDGKEVHVPEIDHLESLYLDNVASQGFMDSWAKGYGWSGCDP